MSGQLELWPDEVVPQGALSWSLSRHLRLRDCARKYYLFHFQSRGGQDAGAPKERRQAFVLRQLRSRFMWVGEVVHEMIELALGARRRGEQVEVDALVARGTRRMRAQYAESVQKVYWERPMSAFGLIEHEYQEPVSRDDWVAVRERMERSLRAFFALPLAEQISTMPPWRWLALEALGNFELEGATVVVRPDFAWREPDGKIAIVDWKTGRARTDDERLQLAIYGLYARRSWGLRDEPLRGVVVHLDPQAGEAAVDDHELLPRHLDEAEAVIRQSVAEMRALADSQEPDAARFPMTEEAARCGHCPFRRLCNR